jgi:hypothetical protein
MIVLRLVILIRIHFNFMQRLENDSKLCWTTEYISQQIACSRANFQYFNKNAILTYNN